jgi:type IV pilus assembly protein PilX
MKPLHQPSLSRHCGAAPQRGAVLIVAMIVLVALGLASLALLRSVDVLGLISGNLSLQRSSLAATDIGVNAAKTNVNAVSALPSVADAANCYSAVMLHADGRGIPDLLAADDLGPFEAAYPECKQVTATNEKIYRLVDRQCARPLISDPKACVLVISSPAGCDQHCFEKSPVKPAYRVTVRVTSAKNTNSYSQVVLY